eukprot:TRINITY_DN9625_c2_g1_i1.p1 TRINITY_DN9625_c2_g1~~TRINITY_DN9625_c2_g1_i1.p1  ORF type:complete len:226 (+),score=26.31 TRINITY_DN9625_c2_g1_i1:55-732(+)
MGEKREGICGKAAPANPFWDAVVPFTFSKPEPDASKFAQKWFDGTGGEPDSGSPDELVLKMKARFEERNAEHLEKYPLGNIVEKKMGVRHKNPRAVATPVFSDFKRAEYVPGYDYMKLNRFRLDQWNHCVGSLGAEHDTCRKAEWYYRTMSISPIMSFYEEMEELGHFDTSRMWGVKNRRSFIPVYQPVKMNIPGAYEYYRSKHYLDNFDAEGDGEIASPICYVE